MKKKKIIIFGIKYFPSQGGTSRVVEATLAELKDEYDFLIYCYAHPDAATNLPNVSVVTFEPGKIKGFSVFLYYLKCFVHLWRHGEADLVHIHKMDAAVFLPLLALKFKCIITSHALPYLNAKWSRIGKLYFRFAERMFMNKSSVQTAISKDHKRYFESVYPREIRYIPNGIDLDHPVDNDSARTILQTHGVQTPYLFFAARRIIPLKGLHTLLKALHKINFQGPIVIAGDMDQMHDYSAQIRKLGKGLDISFIGYISNKSVLLGLIDEAQLFVFPSELEGMSIMLLESAVTSCPIVASDIPANLNVFSAEEVMYFRSKDVDDLAAKLRWSLENPEGARAYGQRAKERVHSDFSRQAMAAQYAALYEEVVQDNAPNNLEKVQS